MPAFAGEAGVCPAPTRRSRFVLSDIAVGVGWDDCFATNAVVTGPGTDPYSARSGARNASPWGTARREPAWSRRSAPA